MLFNKHEAVLGKVATEKAGYEYGFSSMGQMTIKKQAGIKYSIGEISNWVTKLVLLLNDVEAAKEAFELHGYTKGYKKQYLGLQTISSSLVEEFKDEPTKANIAYVSYELDKKCIEEFQACKWTDENIKKFLEDMIKIGRLYQEKTIDYAKKMEKLEIQASPMAKVKPLGMQEMTVVLNEGLVDIDVVMPTGKNIITLNDSIHETRMAFAEDYKKYIEDFILPEFVDKAKLPEVIEEELSMCQTSKYLKPFVDMKAYYKDIVGGFYSAREEAINNNEEELVSVASEGFKEDKSRITNMLRLATAFMSPEDRGAHTKFVSGSTRNNERAERENRFYQTICPEESLLWLKSNDMMEIPFAGYKLLANKGYEEGDFVLFENGMAAKAIVSGDLNGWVEIREFNGELYAAIDLDELITVPQVNNKIIIKVQQSFIGKKVAKDREITTTDIVKAFNTTKEVKFRGAPHFDMELTREDGNTSYVPYDLSNWFFNILKDQAGKVDKVQVNTITSNKNGKEYESVYVSIDLDEIPVVGGIPEAAKRETVNVIEVASDISVEEDSDEI